VSTHGSCLRWGGQAQVNRNSVWWFFFYFLPANYQKIQGLSTPSLQGQTAQTPGPIGLITNKIQLIRLLLPLNLLLFQPSNCSSADPMFLIKYVEETIAIRRNRVFQRAGRQDGEPFAGDHLYHPVSMYLSQKQNTQHRACQT
jgi:hypothetical protein